jgi:hypothetical protein
MDCMTILAQATEATEEAEGAVVPIESIWEYITSLNPLEAVTFISFGVVCLLYGWRIFKILVVICFGLLGMVLGITIGGKVIGENSHIWAGLLGLALMAAISVPLMRWAVSILGAAAGGILTSGLWYATGLTERYIWAGALVGIVAGGMISFIVFKVAVMLFSSLGGSMLTVVGMLALLYRYPQMEAQIEHLVFTSKWFFPVILFIPTAIGLIVQNKFIKSSKEWEV